jgi:hypothetical protein
LWKPTSITKSASGNAAHVLDAAQRALELLALALVHELLLLRQALHRAVGDHRVHVLQALDRALHRLEVGEHAAQPAVVDVRGAGALRLFLHDLARLALGADEEDLPLFAVSWRTNLSASWYIGSDFSRLMMWILLRAPKM